MLHTGRSPLFLRVTDRIGVTAEFGEFGYSLGCNWPIAGVGPQAAFCQKQSFRPGIANRAMWTRASLKESLSARENEGVSCNLSQGAAENVRSCRRIYGLQSKES